MCGLQIADAWEIQSYRGFRRRSVSVQMSKIQAVNYPNQPKLAQPPANHASAQSFGKGVWLSPKAIGEYKGLTKEEAEIAKACEKKIVGWGTKLGEFLAIKDGEVEKQLINALFTASLAPLVIGWNPFSKQDEQTKKYMAARQPLSAGIAIAGGVLMTLPLDGWFSRRCANGGMPGLDLRMAPDKGILKKQVKKENPGIKGKELTAKIEEKQKEITNFFANLISEEPQNISLDNGKVKIKVTDGKPLTMEIPNIETPEQLNAYLDKHSLHRRKFGDLLRETIGLEFFDDGVMKPGSWKEVENSVHAMEFLRKIGIVGKSTHADAEKKLTENALKKILGISRQEDVTIPEISKAVNGGVFKKDGARKFVEAIIKDAVRNDHMMAGKDGKAETVTLGQLFHRLPLRGDDVPLLMDYSIANALKGFAGPLKEFKMENFKLNATIKDFAQNIVANKVEILKKSASTYKGYFNIVTNLAMTAITCTALNWVYPRFVETFLPSLVNKSDKKPEDVKGGNK